MHYVNVTAACTLALALGAGACNRGNGDSPDTTAREQKARDAARLAALQGERNGDISRLHERVAVLDREYGEANQEGVRGNRTATPGLREELKEDVANVARP